jgi:uncharacterized protein YcnI
MKTLLIPLLLATAGAAQAHITLEQPEAPAGSSYRAVFKVGHGCEGGAATKEIVVTLPEGLRGAKPSPKAGWTLTLSPGQIRWTASSEASYLQDAWYDEFIVRIGLPAEPGELWFAVRQVCTQGEANWAERPTADNPRPREPALRLKLLPARPEAHTH